MTLTTDKHLRRHDRFAKSERVQQTRRVMMAGVAIVDDTHFSEKLAARTGALGGSTEEIRRMVAMQSEIALIRSGQMGQGLVGKRLA